MLPSVDLVTVSIDVAVGSGSWNTADFFSYSVSLGGVTHTIAELIGSDLDLIEDAGWITYTAELPTAGAMLLTENLFQFRGTHNGDDILVDNLRIEAELMDPTPPPMPPPVSGEVPEPSAMLMWSGLAVLGLIPWLKRRWLDLGAPPGQRAIEIGAWQGLHSERTSGVRPASRLDCRDSSIKRLDPNNETVEADCPPCGKIPPARDFTSTCSRRYADVSEQTGPGSLKLH